MIGVLLSIGAINALIPIIVILILIAAAAGSTRGSKLFEMFGISALLGMSVGRGTLQKQSPFKSKRFKQGANPFQKLTGPATGAAVNKASAVYNNALMTRAHNVSFDNLGKSGPSLSGAPSGTISDSAHKRYEELKKDFSDRGLSSLLKNSSGRVKTAINENLRTVDRSFEKKKLGVLSSKTLSPQQKQERLKVLKADYSNKMFEAREKFSKDISGITKVSKNTTISPRASLSNHLKMLKFQHLVDKKKETTLELGRLTAQSTGNFSLFEKSKLTPQRLQWKKEREIQKLRETTEEIRKMEHDAKGNLADVFDTIKNSSGSTLARDTKNTMVNAVLEKDLGSEIMDTKKFLKLHKKFVI